jgi:hypothetical protein
MAATINEAASRPEANSRNSLRSAKGGFTGNRIPPDRYAMLAKLTSGVRFVGSARSGLY